MSHSISNPLAGVTVPLVTAMTVPGIPDAAAAEPLVLAMARAGMHNLMLLGSNGEGALIEAGAEREYVASVSELWHRINPAGHVLVNVSSPGTRGMLARARDAVEDGADVLIVSPPSYFRHRDDEILAHLSAVADFGLPFAVYNVPKYANPLSADVLAALTDTESLFVGVKDSSGSPDVMSSFIDVLARRTGVGLTQGDETKLVDALRLGAVGIVPGTANLIPRASVELFNSMAAGNMLRAEELQSLTIRLIGLHAIRPGVPSVKALLANQGFASDIVAPPLAPCTDDERKALAAFALPFASELVQLPSSSDK